MSQAESHLYHPYKSSFLGSFSPNHSNPKDGTGFIISDVDLYYQPLVHPYVVIAFSLLKLLIVIIGEIVYVKIIKFKLVFGFFT